MRAAHEWAVACSDLDTAERLVESSFYYAVGLLRHEHDEWTQRPVELGDAGDRPSSYMLGMQAEWLNLQGREAEALRSAQRGIDVSPVDDDPSTATCWFMLSGASPLLSSTSETVRDAFRHMEAAVANVADLDTPRRRR